MSAWRRAANAWVAACVAALPQQDAATEVRRLHEQGEYGRALELTERIADPELRAEWRFQVLNDGGDLPGALEAAEAGLLVAPEHRALLQNATVCAVTLGLAERSAELCERWRVVAAADGGAALERVERMHAQVLQLLERESALRGAGRRARGIAVGLLVIAFAGLVWLGWRPSKRA